MLLHDWVPHLYALSSDASCDLYGKYWTLLDERLGSKELKAVRPSDITMAMKAAQQGALVRSNSRGGTYAAEHLNAAARRLFQLALADGLVDVNVAQLVAKPKRPPSHRHALSPDQVQDLFTVATDADSAVLRFFLETGARREGLCNLSPSLVRRSRQTVVLDEKGSKTREVPVSGAMLAFLVSPQCNLYDVTRRRLDSTWLRLRRQLPWASDIALSSHWLRHTYITNLERSAGYSVAAFAAGHEAVGTTATYTHVTVNDLCSAWSTLFLEPHPLARP